MTKRAAVLLFTVVYSLPAFAQEPAPPAAPALPDSEELFKKIIERYRPMYEKYSGLETKAEVTTWMYDSQTNELKETTELVMVNKQPFYEQPEEPTILKYVKDGKDLPPEDYEQRGGGEPMFPVFDAKGTQNYSIEVVDKTAMRRKQCYVLEVKGKEESARHFEGEVYVTIDTLDIVFMDGGLSDTPFGVDSMTFQAYMKQQGDLSVWESSTFIAVVDIPILFPDTRMVSKSKVLEIKGIPK